MCSSSNKSVAIGIVFIAVSLAAGMAGCHFLKDLPWIDAFANATMILSGMGPLAVPQTGAGKIFAGLYALYTGLVVLIIAGIMFAPAVRRFHLESKKDKSLCALCGEPLHRFSVSSVNSVVNIICTIKQGRTSVRPYINSLRALRSLL